MMISIGFNKMGSFNQLISNYMCLYSTLIDSVERKPLQFSALPAELLKGMNKLILVLI